MNTRRKSKTYSAFAFKLAFCISVIHLLSLFISIPRVAVSLPDDARAFLDQEVKDGSASEQFAELY